MYHAEANPIRSTRAWARRLARFIKTAWGVLPPRLRLRAGLIAGVDGGAPFFLLGGLWGGLHVVRAGGLDAGPLRLYGAAWGALIVTIGVAASGLMMWWGQTRATLLAARIQNELRLSALARIEADGRLGGALKVVEAKSLMNTGPAAAGHVARAATLTVAPLMTMVAALAAILWALPSVGVLFVAIVIVAAPVMVLATNRSAAQSHDAAAAARAANQAIGEYLAARSRAQPAVRPSSIVPPIIPPAALPQVTLAMAFAAGIGGAIFLVGPLLLAGELSWVRFLLVVVAARFAYAAGRRAAAQLVHGLRFGRDARLLLRFLQTGEDWTPQLADADSEQPE